MADARGARRSRGRDRRSTAPDSARPSRRTRSTGPGGHGDRRDHRALFARTQRRERPDAWATLVTADEARAIVTAWLPTPMREPRYIRRLAKIRDLERRSDDDRDELHRLIDVIVQEWPPPSAAGGALCLPRGAGRLLPGSAARGDRRRRDAGRRARHRRRSGGVAGMIDHTLLKPDATRPISRRCAARRPQFHFATVCVNPTWVALLHDAAGGQRRAVSVRSSGFRWAPRPPTSSATKRSARSSTARARSTWSSTSARSSPATCDVVERDIEAVDGAVP